MVTNSQTHEQVASRVEQRFSALFVLLLTGIAAVAVWLGIYGSGPSHRFALQAIAAGSFAWAIATLAAWLTKGPEPVATKALMGACTVGMFTVLGGVALLLAGMAL